MKEFITTNEPVNGVQKRPYTAPALRIAEFAVETGFEGSQIQYPQGNGVMGNEELEYMLFISSQQNNNAQMGDQMNSYSEGNYFTDGSGYFGI